MNRLVLTLMIPAMVCQAQEAQRVVFTLPKPTGYTLNTDIQSVIMWALNSCPDKAVVWREEYKAIRENKDDLRTWLGDSVMLEMIHRIFNQPHTESNYKSLEDAVNVQKFVKSDRW
jgi:hypothetical protein